MGSSHERGYTWAWTKARNAYIARHPLCVFCAREGRDTLAAVVDHIVPHRGDKALFWDVNNWQSLCKLHHDSDKKVMEVSKVALTKFTDDGKVIW